MDKKLYRTTIKGEGKAKVETVRGLERKSSTVPVKQGKRYEGNEPKKYLTEKIREEKKKSVGLRGSGVVPNPEVNLRMIDYDTLHRVSEVGANPFNVMKGAKSGVMKVLEQIDVINKFRELFGN